MIEIIIRCDCARSSRDYEEAILRDPWTAGEDCAKSCQQSIRMPVEWGTATIEWQMTKLMARNGWGYAVHKDKTIRTYCKGCEQRHAKTRVSIEAERAARKAAAARRAQTREAVQEPRSRLPGESSAHWATRYGRSPQGGRGNPGR